MNPELLRQGKLVMNVLWVVLGVSFLLPGGPLVGILRTVFVITLGAHLLEFAIFHRKLAAAGGGLGHHFVQVLLYGFFHIKGVEATGGVESH